jgi:intein-encoded DNA endonuclease-like protein
LVKYHKKNGKYNTIKYNKSLGYLFGAIVGDGTINISKSTHMPRFKLNVKDKDFANSFANAIYNICNYRPPINIYYAPYRKYKHNYCNNLYYKVSFHSDSFYKLYNKKFDNIINKYPINFLKGVYDAEGYVTLRKDKKHFVIGLGMTNKKIIYLIRKHLDKLNITHKLFIARTRTTNRPYYKIYISNTDSIELFKQKINFSITRKSERLNGNPKYINSINYNTK